MLREDAQLIIDFTIKKVLPDAAVRKAIDKIALPKGRVFLVAIGKAAWQMADAAVQELNDKLEKGIVITKYGHVAGGIPGCDCYEAGHPVPDESSFYATEQALQLVSQCKEGDMVLFLISGGGSALFEKPMISGEELADITEQLLKSGADIVEINTIRKRLSMVKAGRFALRCQPAKVKCLVLSDVLGDRLDMIASGPAYPDASTADEARAIVEKYDIRLSEQAKKCLMQETPKEIGNVETEIIGSVSQLCAAAAEACEKLGYHPHIITDSLSCEAREAGIFFGAVARDHQKAEESFAVIAGGETVVHVTGSGKGGRNQEVALSAAELISGLKDTAVFSVGSDGTDGPTDAAGGYCDGETMSKLKEMGMDIREILQQNDSYHALKKVDGLIMTGPTGTNVNDVSVLLIKRREE